jgi:hypothetical protein
VRSIVSAPLNVGEKAFHVRGSIGLTEAVAPVMMIGTPCPRRIGPVKPNAAIAKDWSFIYALRRPSANTKRSC